MKDENDSNSGVVLRGDQAAFVVNLDGSCEFLLPLYPDDAQLADTHKLLVAIMIRLGDPDWIAEMVEAAEAARKSAPYH